MRFGRSYGVERSVHEGTHERMRRGRGPSLGRIETGTEYLDEHVFDNVGQFVGDYSSNSQTRRFTQSYTQMPSRIHLSLPTHHKNKKPWTAGRFLAYVVICVEIYIAVTLFSILITSPKGILDAYDSISGKDSANNFSKKLAFVSSLVNNTGNADYALSIGFTKEEAEEMTKSNAFKTGYEDDEGNPVVTPTDPVPPSITQTDITELSKLVCQSYLINGEGHYVSKPGDTFAYTAYNTVSFNSINMPPYILGSPAYYARCCNGLSSALLWLCGITTYNDGSNISASWPYIGCEDFLNKVGTSVNVTVAGDLEVGDIICVKRNGRPCGHVETVVKKDSQYVYIASAGSSDGIEDCAATGYRRKFEYSKDLTTYYTSQTSSSWEGLAGVKRP